LQPILETGQPIGNGGADLVVAQRPRSAGDFQQTLVLGADERDEIDGATVLEREGLLVKQLFGPLDGAQQRRQGRGRRLHPAVAWRRRGRRQGGKRRRRRCIVLIHQQTSLLS